MCVVNKQFELLGFVFEYVYVDLQYDGISLTFTAGSASPESSSLHAWLFLHQLQHTNADSTEGYSIAKFSALP